MEGLRVGVVLTRRWGLEVVDVAGQFIHLHYISVCCRAEVSALLPDNHHVVTCTRGRIWERSAGHLRNKESVFDQIQTDGRGATLRSSHLTDTNGCTRLPARCHPHHHLQLIAPAVAQTDQPALALRSDSFPPPLETLFSYCWDSNWVLAFLIFFCFDTYGLCGGGVWHYSSFKYRILDCVTRPNFIKPYGRRAGHKSQGRPPVISSHLKETKQEWDDQVLCKVGNAEAQRRWMRCSVKLRDKSSGPIAFGYSQLEALWWNLTANCEIKHRTLSYYYRYTLFEAVKLKYCIIVDVFHSISTYSISS